MQLENNPEIPAWKDKNSYIKCTVNAGEDEACEMLKNEVLCTKNSAEKVFRPPTLLCNKFYNIILE